MSAPPIRLLSYIAPAAPATRRPAAGNEPPLRAEVGFTPRWYRDALGLDFGERWHRDPAYRRAAVVAMRAELRRRFPGTAIGGIDLPDAPLDLLTGLFGGCTVAALYGRRILYAADNWPNLAHEYLGDDEVDRVEPPDLDANPVFGEIMRQCDWIAAREGRTEGFVNWQGVLNNAQRLRGEALFVDMVERPDRARRLFACVCETMIEGCRRVRARQRASGVDHRFFTVSNCLVNMISPGLYADLLLPLDRRLAETFGCLGVHNCAWNADPYMDHCATLPRLAYIDMGKDSDLARARRLFPTARRALMYTPMDLARLPLAAVRADLERVARDYAPCDLVFADIDAGTPDERVRAALRLCAELGEGV